MSQDDRTTAYDGDGSLVSLFEIWARKTRLSVRTHVPATVTSYDPATQTVACTVDHLEIERVVGVPGADGNNLTKPRPPLVLPSIPVIFPGSGDGVGYLSFPILPQSTGHLVIMDRDLATWLTRQAPLPVDPVMSKLHPLAAAVYVPGLTPTANRISVPTDLTAAVLEHPAIKLGRGALPADRAITITDLAALVDVIVNTWVTVPNDGGAALKTAVTVWWTAVGAGNLLGSQKVTIE